MGDELEIDVSVLAQLAESFRVLVDHLHRDEPKRLRVDAVLAAAGSFMQRADHVDLVGRDVDSIHPYGELTEQTRRLQTIREETGSGPVHDVIETNDVVVANDLSHDQRWPAFARRAMNEVGIASVLAFRLHLDRRRTAALAYYSAWPHAFDDADIAIGAIFASYCSLTLLAEQVQEEIVTATRSGEVYREIGVAIGILMARDGADEAKAYRLLHDQSRRMQRSLRDTARDVTNEQS